MTRLLVALLLLRGAAVAAMRSTAVVYVSVRTVRARVGAERLGTTLVLAARSPISPLSSKIVAEWWIVHLATQIRASLPASSSYLFITVRHNNITHTTAHEYEPSMCVIQTDLVVHQVVCIVCRKKEQMSSEIIIHAKEVLSHTIVVSTILSSDAAFVPAGKTTEPMEPMETYRCDAAVGPMERITLASSHPWTRRPSDFFYEEMSDKSIMIYITAASPAYRSQLESLRDDVMRRIISTIRNYENVKEIQQHFYTNLSRLNIHEDSSMYDVTILIVRPETIVLIQFGSHTTCAINEHMRTAILSEPTYMESGTSPLSIRASNVFDEKAGRWRNKKGLMYDAVNACGPGSHLVPTVSLYPRSNKIICILTNNRYKSMETVLEHADSIKSDHIGPVVTGMLHHIQSLPSNIGATDPWFDEIICIRDYSTSTKSITSKIADTLSFGVPAPYSGGAAAAAAAAGPRRTVSARGKK
jgi:hypothetical protein